MGKRVSLSRAQVLLIASLAVLVLALMLIYFQLGNNRALSDEIASEQHRLTQAQTQLVHLRQLEQNAPLFRSRLAALQQMIPGLPGEEAIISSIYYLADEADLRVTEIRFDNRVETESYRQMPLSVTLEGTYAGLLKTLHHLRIGERAIRVDELRISGRQDGSRGVRAVLLGSAFYLPAEQQ